MLRKGIFIAALCLLPAMASAQARGPWELRLGGSGSNGPDFNGFTMAADGQLGYYFGDNLEVSLRQSVSYNDIGANFWSASTRFGLDYHFPLGDQGQWQPFVGGEIGYVYGQGVHDTFEAGPEAGIKYYVNATTFIFFAAEYQFFFDQHSGSSAFSDGQFIYSLGVGFRF